MNIAIRYDKGLGNAAVYARLLGPSGFWNFVTTAWVETETAECRAFLSETADSSTETSWYQSEIGIPTGGPYPIEYVNLATGDVVGNDIAWEEETTTPSGDSPATATAQSIQFLLSQVRSSGSVLAGGQVWFYAAGTGTLKTVWIDHAKTAQAANPYTLDSEGTAQLYGDGLYRVVIYDKNGKKCYDRDYLPFADNSAAIANISAKAIKHISDYSNSLASAVAAIGSTPVTLAYNSNIELSANITIPVNIELFPLDGAVINHGSYSFSYAGSTVRWPHAQVLDGTGTVTLSETMPEWFGVTGSADNVALQKALAAADYVRMVPNKSYNAAATVTIPDGKTIEGNNATWKRATGSGVYDLFKNAGQTDGNTDIRILNLKVDGNRAADSLVATTPAHRFSGINFVKVSGDSEITGCTVSGTVNNETGGGIYLSTCTDLTVSGNTITGHDRSGIVAFSNTTCMFVGNVCEDNTGSGITGGSNVDCTWESNVTRDNGTNTDGTAYTGLNASGTRSRVIGNTSHNNTGSGITVGEATHAADDSMLTGNVCHSNGLDGLSIQNSARVRSIGDTFYSNTRNNIRVFIGSSSCKFTSLVSRDSAGGHGVLLETGTGHVITSGEIFGNAISGVYAGTGVQVNVASGVRCYNNGKVTSANSCGIILAAATNCDIAAECFDNQGTPTQESGVWVAGGSGHTVGVNTYGNKTYQYRESSSPTNMRYVGVKTGTDPLQGTFTATASTSTVVANNNARTVAGIRVWPLNSGAAGKVPFVSSVSVGVSFTVTLPSSAAGTEVYGYEIK